MDLEVTSTQPKLHLPQRVSFSLWPTIRRFVLLSIVGGMAAGYYLIGTPVTLVVNGHSTTLRTHNLVTAQILQQVGLTLRLEDSIHPSLNQRLFAGQSLEVTLAQPVILTRYPSNQRILPHSIYTHQKTPQAIYQEVGIDLTAADQVYIDGILWPHTQPLPEKLSPQPDQYSPLATRLVAHRPAAILMALEKAASITLVDDGKETIFSTTLLTVGDLLVRRNIPLYLGDQITPTLYTPLTSGLVISIKRARPVSILVDGAIIRTRTQQPTVGGLLAQEGIALIGQDYVIPSEMAPIRANDTIQVVRVTERVEVEKTTADFETFWQPDRNLPLDTQQIRQVGQQGTTKTRTRVRYENGVEVFREEEETWLEQTSSDQIIAYGTYIPVRTLEIGNDKIEYWRKIRMLATSYSAATSGKRKDHPAYGITRTGIQAGYGVVAVDPRVVELGSNVYVPGYGQAIAGDTGGAILGKHIDLGFDEDEPPLWYKWVDVYLLTPVPPRSEIRYVLPQWPQE